MLSELITPGLSDGNVDKQMVRHNFYAVRVYRIGRVAPHAPTSSPPGEIVSLKLEVRISEQKRPADKSTSVSNDQIRRLKVTMARTEGKNVVHGS